MMNKFASAILSMKEKAANKIEHWHVVAAFLIVYDLAAVVGAYFLALWLRFDCRFSAIPYGYLHAWMHFSPVYAAASIFVFWKAHLYQSIWRFASFIELEKITLSSIILGVFHTVGVTIFYGRMPAAYYFVGIAIQFLLIVFIRFAYRFVLLERGKREKELQKAMASRVMMIGAGTAGQMILRDLHGAKEVNDRVCCIIDDNRNKWGRFIDGVPIVGGRDTILLNVEKYRIEKIFLTLPGATAEQRRDILNICKETNCELKIVPSAYALASENVTATSMQDVALEDLL
jgi:FlaA1/EpsC-like NDP-sugar epimerase